LKRRGSNLLSNKPLRGYKGAEEARNTVPVVLRASSKNRVQAGETYSDNGSRTVKTILGTMLDDRGVSICVAS
jgi:hypothetical protein